MPTTGFVALATQTVGSGGAASVTFSSIPQIYKHLQIRIMSRASNSAYYSQLAFTINGASSYYRHLILADGVNPPEAYGYTGQSYLSGGYLAGGNAISNNFGASVIDILDYTNTNKYKTVRALGGANNNSTASPDTYVSFTSGTYPSTTAVSTITLNPESGSFAQHSSIALYGIQG
jgi:hypothetical protein